LSEWGASAWFAILKPLVVGHHEVHRLAFLVLQLDPDCVRVGQPDMRAPGDCPEVSAITAQPVERSRKARAASVAAKAPAEEPGLPVCAHCCAKRMQLCLSLQHLPSERER